MKSDKTRGNGELIDSNERQAVGGDDTIEATALQAATKVIDVKQPRKRLETSPLTLPC